MDTTVFFYAFGCVAAEAGVACREAVLSNSLRALPFVRSKVELLMPLWVAMQFWSLLIVPLVQYIAKNRISPKLWAWIYVPYVVILMSVPSWYTVHNELPPASGFIAMCEMVRVRGQGIPWWPLVFPCRATVGIVT